MMNLKDLRKEKGWTQDKLAKKMSVSRSTIAMWESGKSNPDNTDIVNLAKLLGVSVDILLGVDTALKDEGMYFDNLIPMSKVKIKKVPILGNIACGEPIFMDEEFGRYVECNVNADFALVCNGDSMINARIFDGDLVFIRKQPTVDNGEIAAVSIEAEATLKRVYFYPDSNKLVLYPENPKYEPMVFIEDELEQVRILGKAVAFQSLVR